MIRSQDYREPLGWGLAPRPPTRLTLAELTSFCREAHLALQVLVARCRWSRVGWCLLASESVSLNAAFIYRNPPLFEGRVWSPVALQRSCKRVQPHPGDLHCRQTSSSQVATPRFYPFVLRGLLPPATFYHRLYYRCTPNLI